MNLEEIYARHLVELGHFQAILADLGLNSTLAERSDQVPYHTLLVELEPDADERQRQMAVNFYPADPELVGDSLFLQYFLVLPFRFDAAGAARLREYLPEANNQVVIGHFSLSTAEPYQCHFRYVQTLPADSILRAEAVTDVLTLVSYTPLLYQNVLEDLAAGDITVEQARANQAAQLGRPQ